jgi:ATP-dependent helicase/nuclease subunit A
MIIKKSEIKIIDYKSDINPPEKQADIPQSYVTQLNFYTKIVQKIYPQKNIQAMILWLENGNLMEIPKN